MSIKAIKKLHWFLKFAVISTAIFIPVFIIYFISVRVLPDQVLVNTEVYGFVFRNQVWQGTINISGDLVTLPGTKVSVLPGTKVVVSRRGDRYNLDYLPWHIKNGINTSDLFHGVDTGEPFWDEREKIQLRFSRLEVIGTQELPVEITSDSVPGSPYDINLIKVRAGNFNFVNFSNYRRLEVGDKINITNSNFRKTGVCSICISFGEPLIYKNTFQGSVKSYLWIGLASPKISKNKFLESNGDGIIYSGDNTSNVIVVGNTFSIPGKKSIKVLPVDEGGVISNNFIASGDIELPCNSKVAIKQNYIRSNVIFNTQGGCNGEYVFEPNFWEILNPRETLESRIVGRTTDFKVKIPYALPKSPIN